MNIEIKAKELREFRKKEFQLQKELREMLTELEKQTFGGMTYHQHMATIDETIDYSDKIKIVRRSYSITGYYQVNDDVEISINPTMYAHDNGLGYTRTKYIKANRESRGIPKKYEKQLIELKEACFKYKIENPSDKYSKEFNISVY